MENPDFRSASILQIFEPEFLTWLANFRLPEYELTRHDGQYQLTFHGRWMETTMWEIPALCIINELRSRAALKGIGLFTLDVTYARAKAKMWSKVERLAGQTRPTGGAPRPVAR